MHVSQRCRLFALTDSYWLIFIKGIREDISHVQFIIRPPVFSSLFSNHALKYAMKDRPDLEGVASVALDMKCLIIVVPLVIGALWES
jgi:hypothetical protein